MTSSRVAMLFVLLTALAPSRGAAADEPVATAATAEKTAPAGVDEKATMDEGAAAEAVTAVKRNLGAALEVVRGEGTRDEKLAALYSVARNILDTEAMGRFAIGDALAAQPPERQQEYIELFDRLIVRAYLQKLLLFRNPRFGYGKPRVRDDAIVVRTKIVTAKDEYHVDYEMRRGPGGWRAIDVIVEGISLAQNYQAQFTSLLRDRSFEELLDLMRRKTRPTREEPS